MCYSAAHSFATHSSVIQWQVVYGNFFDANVNIVLTCTKQTNISAVIMYLNDEDILAKSIDIFAYARTPYILLAPSMVYCCYNFN